MADQLWRMPSDADLDEIPTLDLNREIQQRVASLLARGESVQLTCGGTVLCTMHPGGPTEYPDRPGRAYGP